ncbi:transcription elongation factor GreA [Candidatus Gracilibacteria bacterium GN02-872]|nr:transcription elongation factor GreA [Candidatus Gracilibacteria bacterium GN02-872]RKW20787.1 MAG: transcription elongation factor GreA [Candidatus Gracilibacteria bacterium]
MAKIYLTKEGLEKLQNELNHLKTVKRLEIAEKLKEAISFGDLSENSEYEDARNEQAQIEHRIASLEEQLKDIEIIEEGNDNGEKVSIGTIVEIENLETKEKEILKIVGSTEVDIFSEPKMISNESPIGAALLGKKTGTKIKAKALGGNYEFKIISIK